MRDKFIKNLVKKGSIICKNFTFGFKLIWQVIYVPYRGKKSGKTTKIFTSDYHFPQLNFNSILFNPAGIFSNF